MDPGVVGLLRQALSSFSQTCAAGGMCLHAMYATNETHAVGYNGIQFVIFQPPRDPAPVFGDVRGTLLCASESRVAYCVPYDFTTHVQKNRPARTTPRRQLP